MFYYWLKSMMRLLLPVYYRRLKLYGFDNVPATGPFIIACNHPNSFLDAMIVGAYIRRPIHFLTRSDVFNSPLKVWILSQFSMVPIYRLQEGADNLQKNKDTFEKCHKVFRDGGAILIFSEGLCVQEMRLRALKKGTARMALEYSKDGSPLMIIPTGLNYMNPMKFREDVMIGMDKPFNAADLAHLYNENNSKGIHAFNDQLLAGLHRTVIDIRDKANEKNIGLYVEVEYNNTKGDLEKLVQTVSSFNKRKGVDAGYDEEISLFDSYRAALNKHKITDETVARKPPFALLLLPSLVVFGLSFWLYLVPVGLATSLVKKKIKLVEFYDSVLIGAIVIFTFIWWLIIFFTVGNLLSYAIALISIVLIYIVGYFAGFGYDVMTQIRNASILNKVNEREKRDLREMREQITRLTSVINLVKPHQAHHPVG